MMLQALPTLSHALDTLRFCMSAGEPLNPAVIDQWKQHTGVTICSFYGQTETVTLVSNYRSQALKPGSMGRAAPGINVEVVRAASQCSG
jgi:acyl-coenzyme A synthetase/AMP-(fatty) acid ligase